MTISQIIERLHSLANPEKVRFKAQRFEINANHSLGIYMKDLNLIAKEIGKNSELAKELFEVDIYEAKILCGKLFKPKELSLDLVKKWSAHFNNWEICDTFCMGIYAKSPLAHSIILDYSDKEGEFEKRIAFATMAAYCMANKEGENALFESYFKILEPASYDERLYVKKAVNWAIRGIGKRNVDLKEKAIRFSEHLLTLDTNSATWIAKDALKELCSENVKVLDYPRAIYRV